MQPILGLKLNELLQKALMSDNLALLRRRKYPFLEKDLTFVQRSVERSHELFMAELSSHHVHLKTKLGALVPSAFIPFCAYKTDLLLLGEHIKGLKFPVCNKFTPTVLDGQLCYNLDINSALPNEDTLDGKQGELTLILDYNLERSVGSQRSTKNDHQISKRFLEMEDIYIREAQEARIFVHTLKPFSGLGAGSYTMRSLKHISPTDDFLKLPSEKRRCAKYDKQDCLAKTLQRHKLQTCNCTPWEFPQDSKELIFVRCQTSGTGTPASVFLLLVHPPHLEMKTATKIEKKTETETETDRQLENYLLF